MVTHVLLISHCNMLYIGLLLKSILKLCLIQNATVWAILLCLLMRSYNTAPLSAVLALSTLLNLIQDVHYYL